MLECKNLSLIYKDGNKENRVLLDVSLKINKGENVVLLGPSGSGKSSLIYLLSSLRKPTSGSITYNGVNLETLKNKDTSKIRKENFGLIFQMHFLIPYLSVLENIMTAAPSYNDRYLERAQQLLKDLRLEQYSHKKINQLSGGERQRVAIIRALVSEPDIVFADEPTASLDHENAVSIIKMLKDYKENSTLVMATHDTSILSGNERIIRVENHGIKEVTSQIPTA
ncbi:MAG: ATP-binding cassette domain-containing protein [Clostridia bacterium]|nr:ATP-binding cassette domain-containing protein [Clostridia bacterium]